MTKKERVFFSFSLAFRKDKVPLKLIKKNGDVNYNSEKLGKQIDFLPMCLDTISKRKDDIGQRYIKDTFDL